MLETAKIIWRDYTIDGVPSSGSNDPRKSEIRRWGTALEGAVQAAASAVSAAVIKSTYAELAAVAGDFEGGDVGMVILDDDDDLRGIYVLTGGTWIKKDELPMDLAVAAAEQAAVDRAAAEAARTAAIIASDAAVTASDAAVTASATAVTAAEASGNIVFFDDYAAADAAVAGLPDQQVVEVSIDAMHGNARTRYRIEGGALVYKRVVGMDVSDAYSTGVAASRSAVIRDVIEAIKTPQIYAGATPADRVQAAINELSATGGGALHLGGEMIETGVPIWIKPSVTLVGGGGGFRCAPGFSGSELLRTYKAALDYNKGGYAKATKVNGVVLDLAEAIGVVGLRQTNVEYDAVDGLTVRNARATAWSIEGGYALQGRNFKLFGSSVRRGNAAAIGDRVAGWYLNATDCLISMGDVQFFGIGSHVVAGHNKISQVHAWSSYWADDPPMLIGHLDEGEGNEWHGCNADSPTMDDFGAPPSFDNGGIGFMARTYAVTQRLIGCTVQDSNNGDRFPPNDTMIPAYYVNSRGTVLGLEVRKYGPGFGKAVQAASNEIFRSLTIIGGNIGQTMGQTAYLPDTEHPFTPVLRINGGSTGITYGARAGWVKAIHGRADFKLQLVLTSKGGLSGTSVGISGLPIANQSGGAPQYYDAIIIGATTSVRCLARIAAGGSFLTLLNPDGSPMAASNLSDTSEIYIAGSVMTTYGD